MKLHQFTLAFCGLLALGACVRTATDKASPPIEDEVRAAFVKNFSDRQADANQIRFDTPLRVAPPTAGQITPLIGKTVYPVKVDFTVSSTYKSQTTQTHWTNGVYDFYRDPFGDWQYANEVSADHTLEIVPKR